MYSLVILGARGYLGTIVTSYFKNLSNYTVYEDCERFMEGSIPIEKYAELQNLIVINCIGTGVSRGSGNQDFIATERMTVDLVNAFTKFKNLTRYIHFGTIYELLYKDNVDFRNDAYVQSKRNTSEFLKTLSSNDSRVTEIYLPLVISATLPKGRMYSDLICDLLDNKAFTFQSPFYPALSISKLGFLTTLKQIIDGNQKITPNSIVIQPLHELTNLEIGHVIAGILEELTGDSAATLLMCDLSTSMKQKELSKIDLFTGQDVFVLRVSGINEIKSDLRDLVSNLIETAVGF